MTSRSSSRGTTFSIPMTVTSVCGSVVHIRPLPSLSTTQTVPVSATAKFAPLTPTPAVRNFRRRKRRATAVSSRRVVAQALGAGEVAAEERGDLLAVAVDRGDEDVRGAVAGELVDELGQVGLQRRDPRSASAVVEPDLVGGHRLDLDDLVRARPRGRCPPTIAVASAASRAQCTTPPAGGHRPLELLEVAVELAHRPRLIRRPASRRASQSSRSATTRRASRGSSTSPCAGRRSWE